MCSILKIPLVGLIWLSASTSSLSFATTEVITHSDVVWAQPKGFDLTLDIVVPEPAPKKAMPVLVIFHGGGWLLNTKDIMSDLAEYVASHSNIIAVNVNYRRLVDVHNTTTMNEIVEDAMGAVLWVKDHIAQYGGNPKKVAITGDSAGGHLAAMVLLAGRALESDRFEGDTLGFKPSYLPSGKTAEAVAKDDGLKVAAAILSYASFSLEGAAQNGFETAQNPFWGWANAEPRGMFGVDHAVATHAAFYRAVSPLRYVMPRKKYRLASQFVLVGENDTLTPPQSAQAYVNLLKQNRQKVRFKIYPGKGHGFLDSGCNDYNNGCFDELSQPVVDDMVRFLVKTLKPPKK